jgi:hypothetical protein
MSPASQAYIKSRGITRVWGELVRSSLVRSAPFHQEVIASPSAFVVTRSNVSVKGLFVV